MESGKNVKHVLLENGEIRSGDENHYLETLTEFHGEYDIDWVILKFRDGSESGKEVERYNSKFIIEIVW